MSERRASCHIHYLLTYLHKLVAVVADKNVVGICEKFVRARKEQLKAMDGRVVLMQHFFNLWDTGLIGSEHLARFMEIFDSA